MKLRATTLVAALLGILACGLLLLAIYQGIAGAAATYAISEQRQTLADLRRSLRESTTVNADYDELAPKLGPRLRACTWNEQLPYMIKQLTKLAAARGITLVTMQPEPMTTQSTVCRFPMRISFHTDLTRLTGLLQDVKAATPLLKIERFAIRSDQADSSMLLMEMTIASYVILDKDAPLTAGRSLPTVAEAAKITPKSAATKSPAKPAAAATASSTAPRNAATATTATPAHTEQPTGWLRPPPINNGLSSGTAATSTTPAGLNPSEATVKPETRPAPTAVEKSAVTPAAGAAGNGDQK